MKLEFLGSYTSMFGHKCYKWQVTEGAGVLAHKPFRLNDREVLFTGDVVQCVTGEFWSGTAGFQKGTNPRVDRPVVRT